MGKLFRAGILKASGGGEFLFGPLGHAKGVLLAHEFKDEFGDIRLGLEALALDGNALLLASCLALGDLDLVGGVGAGFCHGDETI